MPVQKIPQYVPLPEVSSYTDEVIFGNLNLPIGFDDERLLVNVRAFNRVRAAAGLGRVSVHAESGVTPDFSATISGLDASGAASLGAVSRGEKRSSAIGNVRYPSAASMYDRPDADVSIDSSVMDESLRGSTLRDPRPRARSLDRAVRVGLMDASRNANFDVAKLKQSGWCYGWLCSLGLVGGNDIFESLAGTARLSVIAPLLLYAGVARSSTEAGVSVRDSLSRVRKSYFVGCTPDRFVAGAAVIASSRFIRPLPGVSTR